jgi:uncharacterized protein (UPF0262 family)
MLHRVQCHCCARARIGERFLRGCTSVYDAVRRAKERVCRAIDLGKNGLA